MVNYCAVHGCTSKSFIGGSREKFLSFHHIPNDPVEAKKWLLAMNNPKYPPHSNLASLKSVVVCSLHFDFEDFYDLPDSSCFTSPRRKLRKGRKLTLKFLLLNFKNE